MFIIISRQFSLVTPWGELVLLVAMRWASPDFDVNMPLSSYCLVVSGEQQEESQEDGARGENGL
jgi:hypothetical protein